MQVYSFIFLLSARNWTASPGASVLPAALESSCDDDWVFDNNGKTRTSCRASGSSFTWAVAWSSSTYVKGRD
jgi:hypothetical protein